MIRINVQIDVDTEQRLIEEADKLGITVSELVRNIVLKKGNK